MDNRIFNMNGSSPELLEKVLEIAIQQAGFIKSGVAGFKKDPEKGIILYWSIENVEDATEFLAKPTNKELARMIVESLKEEWAENIPLKGWDKEEKDSDVSCTKGWRAYCENWGHIGNEHYAFLCIQPAYLWHGK